MAKAETDISNAIRVGLAKIGSRIFRNHRGKHLTLDGKRIVTTGLFDGASDLIGWHSITIMPSMVGRRVAIFTAIEVKHRSEASDAQKNFIKVVSEAGGIAGVCRSPEEAESLCRRAAT